HGHRGGVRPPYGGRPAVARAVRCARLRAAAPLPSRRGAVAGARGARGPGRLGELATAVGRAGCNIISLHVVGEPADDGAVTDELLVRVPTAGDPARLVEEIQRAGIPCTLLVRADAGELADPATTALALARMVV